MTMDKCGEYCPVLVGGGNMHINGKCIGKECVWFLPFVNDCAIPTIAGALADGIICQNVFETEQEA